ncbi:hypothetical protein M1O52_04505 [Dehalococcoidia bacterium]|nr:hypothetical protein [Dehalococcoidia bacterium]
MRMKIARVLPLFLVLTLAFAAAGCLVPVEEARVKIALTPEELVEKMVEAIRDVESYQFDMEMTMDMKIVNYGETIETSSLIQSAGQVDRTNQRMMTTMIVETTMPPMPGVPEEVMEMEIEMYWLDGMIYMKASMMPGMPPMWTKGEMPWVCSLEQAVDLLKVSQIDILRVEEVNGVETYVIKVVPDLGKLWEIMMTTMIAPGMDLDPVAMGIDLEEMFDKITMKTWVCRDTFLPVKDQSQMTMVLEGMEKEMSTISRFHSFNEPVTIQLPAEAAEVEEMPQW